MSEPSRTRDVLARIRQGAAAPATDPKPRPEGLAEAPRVAVPEPDPPGPPASWALLGLAVSVGAVVLTAVLAGLAAGLAGRLFPPSPSP